MGPTIQQQIVREYLGKRVTHKTALKVIENDFGGLMVFIGNLKELRKAEAKRKNMSIKLDSRYRHGAFLQN